MKQINSSTSKNEHILKLHCVGEGGWYKLYSATGNEGTWHLSAKRAWDDYGQLKAKQVKRGAK